MNFYLQFSYWIFQPHIWLILGLILLIADIFLGFVLLPFSISALIIAALIYSDKNLVFVDFIFFESWRDILIYYSVLIVLSLITLRYILQLRKKDKSDINKY